MLRTALLGAVLASALLPTRASACDAKALAKAVADASPAYVADAFVALAACSPDEAKKQAAVAIPRFIDADGTGPALLAAVDLGLYEPVRAWMKAQTGTARARYVTRLGDGCATHPAVSTFLADTARAEGDRFWQDRWFKGLATCPDDAARTTLESGLDHPTWGRPGRDRNVFQSVLEAYVKRVGAAALPRVEGWLAAPKDEEEAVLMVDAVGSLVTTGDKDAAVAFLERAAATLPPRAVDRIRGLLQAAGDEDAANRVLRHRWRDAFQEGYDYGAAVVESVVCKNQEERAALYIGVLHESGQVWPDEWQGGLEGILETGWTMDAGRKCKGTSTFTYTVTPEPLPAGEVAAWIEARKRAFAREQEGKKTEVTDAPTLRL